MKFCKPHWDKLREAIRTRGLWPFVAESGEAVAKRLDGASSETIDRRHFEPLMGAHMAVFSETMAVAGLAPMSPKEDGSEWCPLCFLQQNCKCGKPDCAASYERWLDRAADEQLEAAKKLGLVGGS